MNVKLYYLIVLVIFKVVLYISLIGFPGLIALFIDICYGAIIIIKQTNKTNRVIIAGVWYTVLQTDFCVVLFY